VGHDGVPVEQLDLKVLVLVRDLAGALGQVDRSGHVARQVLEVTGPVGGERGDPPALDGVLVDPLTGDLERGESFVPVVVVLLRLEAVELVQPEQRALDERRLHVARGGP
jgi:hypothetical protein